MRRVAEREKAIDVFKAVSRVLMGWMFFWPFLDKMFGLGHETPAGMGLIDGVSPSSFVNLVADGWFKDFFISIGGNPATDFLLMAGLLLIGVTMILGITSKITTVAGCAFCFVMYLLQFPPQPTLLFDYHFVYILFIVALYLLGTYNSYSLMKWWKKAPIVKDHPVLQ